MGHEDVYVNLVNQLNGILAIRVILVINSFEKRIALPIQILLRDEGVPAKYRLSDLLVCIEVEFHGDWSISVGCCHSLLPRDLDARLSYNEYAS